MYSPRHARFCFATHVESQVAPSSLFRYVNINRDATEDFKSGGHSIIFAVRYDFIRSDGVVRAAIIDCGLG